MSKLFLTVPLMLVLVGLAPVKAAAQTPGRSIAGKITSASGSPIPNAKLTIKNLTSGATIEINGNDNGTFIVSDLAPAKYEITAVAPEFTPAHATVTIMATADQVAGIVLYPIKDTGQSVSGVINSKSVSELPLNGRSASDLAALEPGVATADCRTSISLTILKLVTPGTSALRRNGLLGSSKIPWAAGNLAGYSRPAPEFPSQRPLVATPLA